MELVKIDIKETPMGYERHALFKDLNTGKEVAMNFGTLLATPSSKKRQCYMNNDLTDEHVRI
jgi:hypothetical protein